MKKYIRIHCFTNQSLHLETQGLKILELIFNDYKLLQPEYSGFYEPINKPITSINEAKKYWTNGFAGSYFTCRRRSTPKGHFDISFDKDNITCLRLKYTWNKKVDWIALLRELQNCIDGYFGYVHLFTPTEKEIGEIEYDKTYGNFSGYVPGFEIRDKGIPDLAWGTFFGERYLDHLPLKELKKEGFTLKKQGQGCFLTLTDDISTLLKDYDGFEERRLVAKSLFPEGVFRKRIKRSDEVNVLIDP